MSEEKSTYKCISCNKKFVINYSGWYPTRRCKFCGALAMYEEMIGANPRNTNIRPEMAAFGYDKKTGQPVWIDKKGRKYDSKDDKVRYNIHSDPHGWKAAGQKIREKDSKGRINN